MSLLFFLSIFFCMNIEATTLTFINNTGYEVRIDSLYNACTGAIIQPVAPKFLKDKEFFKTPITKVMHHYSICAQGFCSSTAFAVKEDIDYVLAIDLEDGYLIRGTPLPNHWVGITTCENLENL
jgi:hypothetical protein